MPSNQSPLGALPARFRRERVLIVGYGDIGRRIARRKGVAGQGARSLQLLVLSRNVSGVADARGQGVKPLYGDLDDPESLRRFSGIATRVLHLAPPAGMVTEVLEDVRTAKLMLSLRLRSLPRSMVYASTSGVYGDCAGRWVAESQPVAPVTARALRRVSAERVVRSAGRAGLRSSILRIPGIYAPDREGGTPRARLMRGTPVLEAFDDVYTNHIHAEDLASVCWLALWRGQPQRVYHVSDDTALKMGDYFDFAADLYGLPRPRRISRVQAQGELPATLMSFMSESRRLSNRRLKQELRFTLQYPTVQQGLPE